MPIGSLAYIPSHQFGPKLTKALTARFGEVPTTRGTGYTYHVQTVTEAPYGAVRLVLFNGLNEPVEIERCATATSSSSYSSIIATSRWVPLTFSGGHTSVVLPPRYSLFNPSVTFSDWVQIMPPARIDGGKLPIVMFRAYIPETTARYALAGDNNLDWTNDTPSSPVYRRFWRSCRQQVDGVSNPAAFTSTEHIPFNFITAFEYMALYNGITLAGVGDSISSGFGGFPINGGGWGHKVAAALSTPMRPVQWCNLAWNTQRAVFYGRRCLDLLNSFKPDILIYCPFSPNDGTPSQTIIDEQMYWATKVVEKCGRLGIYLMLSSGIPNTNFNWTAEEDAFRLQINERTEQIAISKGIPFLDFDSVMSDGGTPARLNPLLTIDDIHPNNAGYVAMQQIVQPEVSKVLTYL